MTLRLFQSLNSPILKTIRYVITFNRPATKILRSCLSTRASKTKSNQDANCTMRLAYPEDYEKVLKFLTYAYLPYEPVLVNIGLGCSPPSEYFLTMLEAQIKEGMTLIAIDSDCHLIGAAVNAGSCPWDSERLMELAECCESGPVRDAIEFFAYVSCKPNLWERYNVLKIFECSSLAVEPSCQSRGIGRRLLEESWLLARDCGYRLFRIDCTSSYTARMAKNFGWKNVWTMPYNRYVKDCELVFRNIREPHTEVQVYADPLTYCKSYYPPYKKKCG